jgi:hypothetical protein
MLLPLGYLPALPFTDARYHAQKTAQELHTNLWAPAVV